MIELPTWKIWFNSSSTKLFIEVRAVILPSNRYNTYVSIQLDFTYTNNHSKYEAMIIRLEILLEMKANSINVQGDL